jgi:hypothetical protein
MRAAAFRATAAAIAMILGSSEAAAAAPQAAKAQPAPSIANLYWVIDCLLTAKSKDVEKLLSVVPDTPEYERLWWHTLIGACLTDEHPIPAATFYKRGAVAERLLYRDFSAIGSPPRRAPVPVFAPVEGTFLAGASPKTLSSLMMLDAVSCLVRQDPQRAYSFFRLERGSSEESRIFSEMAPGLSGCVTEGQPLKLTPAIFRAFLAEAAYRVAAGQPDVIKVEP